MRKFILTVGVLVIIACVKNKETKKTEETDPQITVVTNHEASGNYYFEVEMDVVVEKNDKFHLFYKDFNDSGYSSIRVLEQMIRGRENSQKVVFSIPEGVIPIGLRIDVGMNYSQSPIILNSLKIRYDRKEFYFNEEMFIQLFRPNKFTYYSKQNKTITTQPIDGKFDPHYISINLEEIIFSLLD
jgi:hypothetical protein